MIDKIIYSNNLYSVTPPSPPYLIRRFYDLLWLIKNFIKLKTLSFDICIFLDSAPFLALAAKLLRIKIIAGPATRHCGYNQPSQILKYLTYPIEMPADSDRIHISERYQTVIRSIINTSNIELPVLPALNCINSDIVRQIKDNKNKKIFFCLEGEGGFNKFPLDSAVIIIDAIVQKFQASIYFIGTDKNIDYAQKVASQVICPTVNLCGKTNLCELKEILKLADLLISIDTGVVHLAAAENIKIISMYGPGLPNNSSPVSAKAYSFYREQSCSPCHFKRETEGFQCPYKQPKCLADINSDEVAKKAIEMLDNICA